MHHAHHDCSGILYQILSSEDYAIALTPGFYRFYALIGVLQALEERGCLRPSHVSGASAGALVGGFLASGTLYLCVVKKEQTV
jgi:predicted acylesterase/phospholipase RssA